MPDKKISELTELVAADIASNDELVIVDTSAGETKRTSVSSLVSNDVPVDSGSIGSVAVVEDVQSKLYLEAFAKTFDKNVLLRDGDGLGGALAFERGLVQIPAGDIVLGVANVVLNSGTATFPTARATDICFSTSHSIGVSGTDYFISTATAPTTAFNRVVRIQFTDILSSGDFAIFNLT